MLYEFLARSGGPLTVNLTFHIIPKHDDEVQIWKKRGKLAINNSSYHETAAKKNHDYPNKSCDTLNVCSSFLQTFVSVKLRIISSLSAMAICVLMRKNFADFFAHVEKRIWRKQLLKWLQCWRTFTLLDLPWLDWSLATKLSGFHSASHLVDVKCCSPTKNKSTNKCAVSWLVQRV